MAVPTTILSTQSPSPEFPELRPDPSAEKPQKLTIMYRMTLRSALRQALRRILPTGWLYLPDEGEVASDTACLLLTDGELEGDDADIPLAAVEAGFPHGGLNTDMIEDTAECARRLHDPPDDELLLESYTYYLKYDAFLPRAGAPEPLPREETQLKLDREFYDSLGAEAHDVACKRHGCQRGAVALSVLCRLHHFESIKQRPCPFDD